jgi:hypothetical protein
MLLQDVDFRAAAAAAGYADENAYNPPPVYVSAAQMVSLFDCTAPAPRTSAGLTCKSAHKCMATTCCWLVPEINSISLTYSLPLHLPLLQDAMLPSRFGALTQTCA